MTGIRRLATTIALAALLPACGSSPPALQPFTTDGCSLFPDRSWSGQTDWCSCCLAHDLTYWRGGTAEERLKADEELKRCVVASTGKPELADLMFTGVRMGGSPYFLTPYRWGYGWTYGRGYNPLTEQEDVQASMLRAQYLATNPTLACRKPAAADNK